MKIRSNFGISRTVALAGEARCLFVLNLSPLRLGHLPCCPQVDYILDVLRMALDENHTNLGIPRTVALAGEASYLFFFDLRALPFRAPVAPNHILLWIYEEWHWIKICSNLGRPRIVTT